MRLLLDTCTFLWFIAGASEISADAKRLVVDPGNEVFVSVVSAWEIAVKWMGGRLELAEPPGRLVPVQRRAHGIQSLALDEEAVLHVARLPPLHRDPFDRMLVSQALVHGLTIVTPDELIAQYPARSVW
jgi:PIN domain nuclease of toxin-antitoxin system